MKIAVVFTGGTIASKAEGGVLSPSASQNYELLRGLPKDVETEVFTPYFSLSEQLDGELLTKLISCVGEILAKDFDGIIVTHGTDTLQYSAAALALAFGRADVPIVLVSSNYILSDPRSNGRANFRYAELFIRRKIGGVFVSYQNEGQPPKIFAPDSLLAHDAYSDELRSIYEPVGFFEGDNFYLNSLPRNRDSFGVYKLSKYSPVLVLRARPGMSYPDPSFFSAFLFETYHSGTLPTADEAFAAFCKRASGRVWISGFPDDVPYESTTKYSELNIKILPYIAPIYSYMKLWVLAEKGEI